MIKAGSVLAASTAIPTGWAIAQAKPLKVGLMLPYSGTFAKLGENITFAVELLLAEKGGKLGGREIQFIKLDDESKPENGPQNADRLVKRDQVDVLIGTVHSGVQMGIHKVVQESGTLTISQRRQRRRDARPCAKNVFRSSFTNWQPAYGMGLALGQPGFKKAVWVTWDYAAGNEPARASSRASRRAAARCVPMLTLPFPETNFQPLLAQIPVSASTRSAPSSPAAAPCSSSGYAAAGLKVPLCGSGFLTEGTLEAQGAAAEGIETALHYGDGLDNAKNTAFRKAFKDKAGRDADVYAVQGYDAAQLLAIGPRSGQRQHRGRGRALQALRAAKLDSPRGPISMSPAHNLDAEHLSAQGAGGQNQVVGIAAENLADPGTGCRLA